MKLKTPFLLTSAILILAIAAQAQPKITQVIVVPIGGGNVDMTIKGSGFGSANPFNNDSQKLRIFDASCNWEAGYSGDGVTVNVTSWTDTEIDIASFTGQYKGLLHSNYKFNANDQVQVSVQNSQGWSSQFALTVPAAFFGIKNRTAFNGLPIDYFRQRNYKSVKSNFNTVTTSWTLSTEFRRCGRNGSS